MKSRLGNLVRSLVINPNKIQVPELYMAGRLGFPGMKHIPDENYSLFLEMINIVKMYASINCLYNDFDVELYGRKIKIFNINLELNLFKIFIKK
jgi:hypothetical protein